MKKLTLGLTTVAALFAFANSAVAAAPGETAPSVAPAPQPAPAPVVVAPAPGPVAAAPAPIAAAPAPQPQTAPYPGYVPEEYYEEEEMNPRLSRRERRRLRRHHREVQVRGPVLPPARLPYRENAAPPPGYVVQETNIRPLVVGGAVSFAVPYIIGLTAAVVTDFKNETGWLAIPVVGPWVAREKGSDDKDRRISLGLDGIFQGAGAAMLIVGLAVTKKEFVRNDLAKNLWIAPTHTANGGYGFAMGGQF